MQWKNRKDRKPLILRGVRQCGKTWALKEFGRTSFENVAYFNFDFDQSLASVFESTKDPKRLIPQLSLLSGVPIEPQKTLIVFDEIQCCGKALNSLKYFCEDAPEYAVASAGSLLGVSLSKDGFPVGKVQFLNVYPMDFEEYLAASGAENFANYMQSIDSLENIPLAFASPLEEKLKQYFVSGGMPGLVKNFVQNYDSTQVDFGLDELNDSYERDFARHADRGDFPRISLIWKSVPSQLARENKKFMYSAAKPGARAREYEDALMWLANAGLTYKVARIKKPGIPLLAYEDLSAFKIYLADVGLLRRLSRVTPQTVIQGDALYTEFRGAFAENYVLQALRKQYGKNIFYWTDENSRYEVDFIVQHESFIIPVEVKSGKNIISTSMKNYASRFDDTTKLRVRFSMKNLSLDENVLNIPLYLADQAKRLIALAVDKMG
ncbi:ATP-binding protein [Fibrobacter sp. UWR4]|uniref:ATP-binding protein n=1 Tax=Fibrobacter sp. UWR4 TaxID=1896218 RepID=UPI0018EE7F2A|nr:ATP-binding protein [Fibrobacter sp. UWR4]